jgi:streptogramin lyase
MRKFSPLIVVALSMPLFASLAGCGVSPNTVSSSIAGAGIRGALHGGQQPVTHSRMYLMAASTSGYGTSSTSLLNPANAAGTDSTGSYVLTQADGSFAMGGDFTCTPNQQLYVLAMAGNPGLSDPTTNAQQISLMAAVGPCSGLANVGTVNINEVSTIATAYALAAFTSSPTQIATSISTQGATNLANAFATVTNLESLNLGQALAQTPAGNGTVPQSEIHTLANILASCVNTSDGSSSPCATLFANAQTQGTAGTVPTTTAQAAINIAHNPGSVGVNNLFVLQGAEPPFQPSMAAAPTDFSISVSYNPSEPGPVRALAVDASGNIWVPCQGASPVELSPLGAMISPAGGYTGGSPEGYGAVIDLNGNVWISSNAGLVKYGSNGSYMGSYSGGNSNGASSYERVAIDSSDNIWLAHSDGLGLYSNSGTALSPASGYATNTYVADVRLDSLGNAWITDKDGFLAEFNSSGTQLNQYEDGSYGASAPLSLAIDSSNRIWVADSNTTEVSRFTVGGTQTMYSGGGTSNPYDIAIDGANSAWIVNLNGTVSAFNSNGVAITPAAGYSIPVNNNLVFDAVDGSGNLWVSLPANSGSIEEFVGLTVPVVTPITPNHLGMMP